MTVNTHLTGLASSLILSGQEESSITTSISTLSSRLISHFGTSVTSQFRFGSSTRGTILPRKADASSDIDYMIVFSTTGGKLKPQSYIDRLKKFAEAKYSSSEIKQSHPTVVLSLNHISFDLVPAIDDFGLQIPSPTTSWTEWMRTDPNSANTRLQTKNMDNSSQIKPLVRLVKYWNALNGHPFASFYLENNIIDRYYFSCISLKDFFYSHWESFNCAYNTPQYIKDKVELAKSRAKDAKYYEGQGLADRAETEIRKVVPPL